MRWHVPGMVDIVEDDEMNGDPLQVNVSADGR